VKYSGCADKCYDGKSGDSEDFYKQSEMVCHPLPRDYETAHADGQYGREDGHSSVGTSVPGDRRIAHCPDGRASASTAQRAGDCVPEGYVKLFAPIE
jgi:hypothetical protein